ncbi:hypothetical protein [Novacetimonas hansenii]|uniref:NIPSNAP domain-containing protein n=1 Tax=Novacetimonas hansenii TaxID=436 RepID=A0ABQ0SHA0_NOVHA|nr:hypothetical protein [Novacetimonas hansenii]GAN84006.1 hypothetical protein Gaha_0122_006 [Novacetimonas hansenii JCM 7643]GBQ55908.1 hypothetical protein AA0243_1048 [Novacetimonas hansenii NRIC 0243]GEC64586.1 hypothetical protein GHA01_24350 [Novacetimonas hansenii]
MQLVSIYENINILNIEILSDWRVFDLEEIEKRVAIWNITGAGEPVIPGIALDLFVWENKDHEHIEFIYNYAKHHNWQETFKDWSSLIDDEKEQLVFYLKLQEKN